MSSSMIKTSGFSLAKEKELTGDDFYEVKTIGDIAVAIVCDGVGSATEGAQAAKRVTRYLMTNFKNRPTTWSIEKSVKTFISSINTILYQESMINYERPELVTTLTIVIIEGDRLYGANVGDSRVYLYRDKKLNQLSFDQVMEEEYGSGVLAQAIGIDKEVTPHYFENIVQEDDKILLCSDGLNSVMSDDRITSNMHLAAHGLVKKASTLMEDDLPDDTTAVTIHMKEIAQTALLKNLSLDIPEKLTKGEILDGYTLTESLIQNDRTWLCEKEGEKFVIKFAPYEAKENKVLLDLFVREAWNAKRLKAGFFPKTFIPEQRNYRYYLMEPIEGITLKKHLKKRKLSIDDTITLAKTLLKMGQYLIKFDLLHGDIKPENIMVSQRDGKNVFKVIDFGNMTEVYSIDSKAGTPSYLAPERFEGGAINESTELFAIGVTLYEALTATFPYGEIEPFQTPVFKGFKSADKLNPNIPLWLSTILSRSLTNDTDRRYQNYSHMLYELENSDKVTPFYDKNSSIFEREKLLFCRIALGIMVSLNIITLYYK